MTGEQIVEFTILLKRKNLPAAVVDIRHDIWHFLGGAGLFFVFLFILTIDEDIKYTQRTKIAVF